MSKPQDVPVLIPTWLGYYLTVEQANRRGPSGHADVAKPEFWFISEREAVEWASLRDTRSHLRRLRQVTMTVGAEVKVELRTHIVPTVPTPQDAR